MSKKEIKSRVEKGSLIKLYLEFVRQRMCDIKAASGKREIKEVTRLILTCWREGLLPVGLPRSRAKAFLKPSVPTPSLDRSNEEKQTVPQNKILKILAVT